MIHNSILEHKGEGSVATTDHHSTKHNLTRVCVQLSYPHETLYHDQIYMD